MAYDVSGRWQRVAVCCSVLQCVATSQYAMTTGGGEETLNHHDNQHFQQVFTGVPIRIKHVFTGVPTISIEISPE